MKMYLEISILLFYSEIYKVFFITNLLLKFHCYVLDNPFTQPLTE